MLKSLRNKKLMQVIMWGLVVIFAAWGMGSMATSRKSIAGTIFHKSVSAQEYSKSYNAVLNRAKMMYGDKLPKLEKLLDLKNQAWDRLILLAEGKKKRLKATNKEVIEKIASFPFFQQNDQFDTRLYNYIVANVFQSAPHDFEESVRGDIIIEKLINSSTGRVTLTENEIKDAYRVENELADVSFILINPDDYKQQISVTEAEIRAFYDQNKDGFLKPATMDASYLKIPFGENKEDAQFAADEISVDSKKKKSLQKIADKYELELKETGGFSMNSAIPGIGLSYPFTMAALTLESGQISDPIEAEDAFYIIQLKSKTPPTPLSFDEAREEAKDMLIDKDAESIAKTSALETLSKINAESVSLEDIAKEQNQEIKRAKQIARGSYVKEVGLSEEFSETVFSLNLGKIGGPAKTQKGYAIIRLDTLKPIEESKFLEEKESFSEKLMSEKRKEHFQQWFAQIKKKANLQSRLAS